jgi:lipoprotein NlpD
MLRRAPVASELPKAAVGSPTYGDPLVLGKPYRVQARDTLYAIAFRLGADFRTLASLNHIPKPYTIFPGQVLKTAPDRQVTSTSIGTATSTKASSDSTTSPAASKAPASKTAAAKPTATPTATQTAKPATKATTKVATATVAKVTPPSPAVTPSTSTPQKSRTAVTQSSPSTGTASEVRLGPVTRWRWPSSGKVVRNYQSNFHKGVDIAGNRGDPVQAVADGQVVYAGTGVKGYGALLIVKHNDEFLSAYGHNDAILVAEGEGVRAGQQIAQKGSSGTDTVKLHFEIRRQGKPVDPLKLLPSR